jgi:hypothetical protein
MRTEHFCVRGLRCSAAAVQFMRRRRVAVASGTPGHCEPLPLVYNDPRAGAFIGCGDNLNRRVCVKTLFL